jgi:hypothetical protein
MQSINRRPESCFARQVLRHELLSSILRVSRALASKTRLAVMFQNCRSRRVLDHSLGKREEIMPNQFWRILILCLIVTFASCQTTWVGALYASESPSEIKKFTFHGALQGSANSQAQVNRLEASAGYNFSPKFAVDFGLPFYFVNSNVSTDPNLNGFRSGLGNAFVSLRATPSLRDWHYISSLTATAPTGDRDRGFSTGRVTVDWNNFFSRSFSRLTPFVNLGVANTVSDTSFFYRPFSSLGVVAHFEGGASYRLNRSLSIGTSAYSVVPSGEQKIYSRVRRQNDNLQPSSNTGDQVRARAFETAAVIVDDASLARDHGLASWMTIYPSSAVYLRAGYHRSAAYSLNTFFFGVGLQLDSVYGRIIHP